MFTLTSIMLATFVLTSASGAVFTVRALTADEAVRLTECAYSVRIASVAKVGV